jgi:hypothetical protein
MLPLSPDVLSSYRELNEIGVAREFVYALMRTFESENEFVGCRLSKVSPSNHY